MAQNQITRRNFLGGAAVAAISASAASILSGCGPTGPTASDQDNSQVTPTIQELNPQDESFKTYTTDYASLFEPLQIGSQTLHNRLVKSAAGSDTLPKGAKELSPNFLDYYGNFAKGGASMVWVEGLSDIFKITVAPEGNSVSGLMAVENAAELMKPIADRVHENGGLVGYQYYTMTMTANDLTVDGIHFVQQSIVDLALKFKNAGFDAFEINASAAHFFNSFLSRNSNKREDEYGPTSIENRTRIITELIPAIKKACGSDFIVQVVINAVEENDAAIGANDKFITVEEAIENAMAIEKAGADSFYIRASVHGMHIGQFAPDLAHTGYKIDGVTGYGTQFDFSQHFGGWINGQYSGCASWLKVASEIKKNVSIPVGVAGYMDPRTAPDLINNAVANGEVDFIIMNRPLTVDPELPNKLKEGRRDEVAPCCRCMHCHNKAGVELCRVNAVTQRAYGKDMPEGYEILPTTTSKKVMVIGGGPAGMEAARVAAMRGHSVTLYEQGSSLGGLMKTAHAFKGDHELLGDLIDYLTRQQEIYGVTVVTGTAVDTALIEKENPDAVVLAVGGARESKLQQGDGTVKVISVMDSASAEIGENIVILGAGAQAVDCALFMLAQGKKVQMVHGDAADKIDKEQSMWVQSFVKPHLYSKGVKIWNSATVTSLVEAGIYIKADSGYETTLECDTVIECYDMLPSTALFDALSGKFETYAVGDCSSPFNILQAISSGNLAARKL